MGLDITAYSNIRLIETKEEELPTFYFSSSVFPQSNMPEFEDKEMDIEFDEEFDFRAGSYSSYNNFRNALCIASNGISQDELFASSSQDFKFYWLIFFTDCDGYIGTSYCKILYDEFCKYEDEVKSKLSEYHQDIYDYFKKAFEIGANNGLVNFH